MQETLLALCALFIFAFFALSQHGAKASVEEFAITAEVEMAAGQVARQRLGAILAHAFDEADADTDRARTSPTGLSTTFGPDDGEATEADYDDVDDFHGSAQVLTTEWVGQAIAFSDSISVAYLDPATLEPDPSGTPSFIKEVTVVVRAAPDGFIGTPEIAATLQQIVTAGSR